MKHRRRRGKKIHERKVEMARLNCFSFYREEICRWLSNIGTWVNCKEQPLGDQLFRMGF